MIDCIYCLSLLFFHIVPYKSFIIKTRTTDRMLNHFSPKRMTKVECTLARSNIDGFVQIRIRSHPLLVRAVFSTSSNTTSSTVPATKCQPCTFTSVIQVCFPIGKYGRITRNLRHLLYYPFNSCYPFRRQCRHTGLALASIASSTAHREPTDLVYQYGPK